MWYFEPKGASQLVTVALRTVVHPNLSCHIVTSTHQIPRSLCKAQEAVNAMPQRPILLIQEDHNLILDKNERRDRIDYEQHIEIDGDSSDED